MSSVTYSRPALLEGRTAADVGTMNRIPKITNAQSQAALVLLAAMLLTIASVDQANVRPFLELVVVLLTGS